MNSNSDQARICMHQHDAYNILRILLSDTIWMSFTKQTGTDEIKVSDSAVIALQQNSIILAEEFTSNNGRKNYNS